MERLKTKDLSVVAWRRAENLLARYDTVCIGNLLALHGTVHAGPGHAGH